MRDIDRLKLYLDSLDRELPEWATDEWIRIAVEATFWIVSLSITMLFAEARLSGASLSTAGILWILMAAFIFTVSGLLSTHRFIYMGRSLATLLIITGAVLAI